jgi:CubicO group peptidase (beta-lactamase class C family)
VGHTQHPFRKVKQFTVASILLLEERGKLKVDDPVNKYMPDAPAAWDKITIFHLLTHTSGIPSFTGFPDYKSKEPFSTTPEERVARFRAKPLDFQPGEKMSYSNSGYVLGYLIEKITLETYDKFVQENIFAPLGMKDSGYEFEFRNHSAPGERIRSAERAHTCRFHPHNSSLFRGRALFHHRGPAEMGARAFGRQSSFGEFVAKDDHAS